MRIAAESPGNYRDEALECVRYPGLLYQLRVYIYEGCYLIVSYGNAL